MKMFGLMGAVVVQAATSTRYNLYAEQPALTEEEKNKLPANTPIEQQVGKWEHSPDLPCGECIARGFNFCYRNGDSKEPTLPGKILSDRDMPEYDNKDQKPNTRVTEQVCCKDMDDGEFCDAIVKGGN